MGVKDFLKKVLPAAGTELDLRQFRDGIDVSVKVTDDKRRRRRRPLRIGVDLYHWVIKANYRFCSMLADEKHLTNYGRNELVQNGIEQQQQGTNCQQSTTNDIGAVDPATARKYISLCSMFVIERLEALKHETNAEIIAVLDGDTPPIKKPTVEKRSQARKENMRIRDAPVDMMMATPQEGDEEIEAHLKERLKANRRTGAGPLFKNVIEELILGLREKKISFLVAPYEADGQLAWMSRQKYVDLIVTEDSDFIAQGGVCMIYKMNISITYPCSEQPDNGNEAQSKLSFIPKGILLKKDDIGAVVVSKKGKDVRFTDMSDAMIAVICVAAGSDYSSSLGGIALIKAAKIVQTCFLQQTKEPPLELVFRLLFQQSYGNKPYLKDSMLQEEYKQQFLAALLMYRHPVIYCPFRQTCIVSYLDSPDPELTRYKPYEELLNDAERRSKIIGDLIDGPMATLIAEGWVAKRTLKLFESAKKDKNLPKYAKRMFGLEEDTTPECGQEGQQAQKEGVNGREDQFDNAACDLSQEDVGNEANQLDGQISVPDLRLDLSQIFLSQGETQYTVGNHGLETQEIPTHNARVGCSGTSADLPPTQESTSTASTAANPQEHDIDEVHP